MQPGDWVRCVNVHHYVYGWLGYVEWTRPPECSVVFTLTKDGRTVNQKRRMLISEFVPAEEMNDWTSQEIEILINLALDTRDKEWFQQLTSRKGGGRVGDTAEGLHV
ncbi:IDEAL domain-containing protein [Geobacillus kaustophilus]|uniref:IDEAL domain-containing protein n=1 Tax=Geobacillus kaustophilus TaxID=1462 RepID=UPI0005CD8FA7|nr:IDEAL domain-containing protein [Geobacillus kaustophilus]WJQ02892.1 IDEAL domain-containing protein [Geobacillus stearothermophilus]WJQ03236.1 IDEAL domain-containing protein [Geobacillus stearothermophilus]